MADNRVQATRKTARLTRSVALTSSRNLCHGNLRREFCHLYCAKILPQRQGARQGGHPTWACGGYPPEAGKLRPAALSGCLKTVNHGLASKPWHMNGCTSSRVTHYPSARSFLEAGGEKD